MKYFLCICLCALTFISYSDCSPMFTKDMADKIDEEMDRTIKREKLTCENLHQFCYGNQPEDHDVADDLSRQACEVFLQPYLCPNPEKPIWSF